MTFPLTIYVIPNFECNLSCPHCELSQKRVLFDHDKLMDQVMSIRPEDNVILFGGEPTLFKDRFEEIMNSGKVKSVSTNLLNLTDKALSLFIQRPNISIGTSWNLQRFTKEQEHQWLENLRKIAAIGRKCEVMITLTGDLIADSSYQKVHDLLAKVQSTDGVDKILFEHYVGETATADFNMRCDDWLCRIHSDWTYKMKNMADEQVLSWNFDCTNIMTLLPDGTWKDGCPQDTCRNKVCVECLECQHAAHCRPCILQHSCSFPKKLYKIVKKEKEA